MMAASKVKRRKKIKTKKDVFKEKSKEVMPFSYDRRSKSTFDENDKEEQVIRPVSQSIWKESQNKRVKRKEIKKRKKARRKRLDESGDEEEAEGFDEKLKTLGYEKKINNNVLLPIKRKWKLPGEVKRTEVERASKEIIEDLSNIVGVLGQEDEKDEEETMLEDLVFGSTVDQKLDNTSKVEGASVSKPTGTVCAWEDADDARVNCEGSVDMRDHQREAFLGTPSWAQLTRSHEDSDDDDEMIQRVGNVLRNDENLPPRFLDTKRCKHLNWSTHNEGSVIKVAKFHPRSQVALVAGSSGVASLIQVDGDKNPRIQAMTFKNFPIRCAEFIENGDSFIATSGVHRHLYYFDMMTGKVEQVIFDRRRQDQMLKKFIISPDSKLGIFEGNWGSVHLFSVKSREWIETVQFGGKVSAMTFSADGRKVFAHTDIGEVFVYDVGSRSCVHKFIDDGCVSGTSVAASPNAQLLACGSNSGVVNVYNTSDIINISKPTPIKIFLNLVTSVSTLAFNPTSEILAMASEEKNNAIRLGHIPSLSVFQNFPASFVDLRRPNCVDFSLNSGYMSIGSNNGTAYLYRLRHYKCF